MTHIIDQVSLGAIVQVRDRLLTQQAEGKKVLRLESGDPSFDIPPIAREAMEKALRDGLTHYTASTGILLLREAILRKVMNENKLNVPNADHIVVTNGGMNGLYIIFQAILESGDEVILPDPMWTEIAENIRLGGGVPVPVRLRENENYRYSPEDIEAAITAKTKAIFVNTPQNPTGSVLGGSTLEAIAALAEKHNLLLVSDEAYEHVIFDGQKHVSLGSLPAAQDRTISVFTLSKTYAMSGLRIGYVVTTNKLLLERFKKLVRCIINGVNSVAQYGAAAALNGPQDQTGSMTQEYQARRDLLFSALDGSPYLKPFKPNGAFYLWARIVPDWPGYQGRKDDWSMTNYLIDRSGIGFFSRFCVRRSRCGAHPLCIFLLNRASTRGLIAIAVRVKSRGKIDRLIEKIEGSLENADPVHSVFKRRLEQGSPMSISQQLPGSKKSAEKM